MDGVTIPNRPAFRAQEVCEIAGVPPFVLRGWEAEFPDLGAAKTAQGPRTYKRSDVERVLRLKSLILVEGLTLAGARRRLAEEAEAAAERSEDALPTSEVVDAATTRTRAGIDDTARGHLLEVKRGLQWILDTLGAEPTPEFTLAADPQVPARRSGNGHSAQTGTTKTRTKKK